MEIERTVFLIPYQVFQTSCYQEISGPVAFQRRRMECCSYLYYCKNQTSEITPRVAHLFRSYILITNYLKYESSSDTRTQKGHLRYSTRPYPERCAVYYPESYSHGHLRV